MKGAKEGEVLQLFRPQPVHFGRPVRPLLQAFEDADSVGNDDRLSLGTKRTGVRTEEYSRIRLLASLVARVATEAFSGDSFRRSPGSRLQIGPLRPSLFNLGNSTEARVVGAFRCIANCY